MNDGQPVDRLSGTGKLPVLAMFGVVATRLIQMIASPRSAIRHVLISSDLRGGVIATCVVWAAIGFVVSGTALIGDGVERAGPATLRVAFAGATVAAGAGVGFTALAALCLHLSAYAVGGAGRFRQMHVTLGFASITGVLWIPGLVAADALDSGVGAIVRRVVMAVSVTWWIYIVTFSVRHLYAVPWRAVPGAIFLAAIGVISVLVVLLVLVFFIALLAVMVIVP